MNVFHCGCCENVNANFGQEVGFAIPSHTLLTRINSGKPNIKSVLSPLILLTADGHPKCKKQKFIQCNFCPFCGHEANKPYIKAKRKAVKNG